MTENSIDTENKKFSNHSFLYNFLLKAGWMSFMNPVIYYNFTLKDYILNHQIKIKEGNHDK
ncbi:hypothetical protein RyT2_19380 [Pseudolactococcus yaeyamensis]